MVLWGQGGHKSKKPLFQACLTNVPYLGLIAEQCAYLVVVTSFVVFLPVYLRSMYGTPEDEAKYLTGKTMGYGSGMGSRPGSNLF